MSEASARREALVVASMLLSVGLVFATTLSVSGALPEIGEDLAASQTELHLVANVYPVMVGALVLPFGALLDRHGRRRGMCAGLVVMIVGMLWSGYASDPAMLILSRVFTGAGGALVLPGTLATITHVSSPDKRSRNIGLWAGATMIGGTAGFIIGGAMLEFFWWGSSFLVFSALSALCLAATIALVPETHEHGYTHIDPLGSLLSVAGVGALVFATVELPERGIGDSLVLGCAVGGAIGVALFVAWELRTPTPLLDLRLFRNRTFASGVPTVFLTFAAGIAFTFLSFQYLSYSLGYSALLSGVALLPCAITVAPAAAIGPRLAARHGRRNVMAGALVASAGGCLFMGLAAVSQEYLWMAPAFFVYGIGLGLGQAPPTEAITESLPRAAQGLASAINDTARELGGAIGIAVFGSAFNAAYRDKAEALLAGAPDRVLEPVRDSPAVGLEVAAHARRLPVADAVHAAVASGYRAAFVLAAVACLVFAAFVYRLSPR